MCGNKHLSWAFVEAAHIVRRSDEQCRRWYDRKKARSRPRWVPPHAVLGGYFPPLVFRVKE